MTSNKNMKYLVSMLALIFAAGFAAADTMTIVSDTNTQWSADGSSWSPAVACWVHPLWPTISGATWIWRTAQTDGPWEYANVPEGGWYFQQHFTLPDCASNIQGSLQADADNAYSVSLNGQSVGGDGAMSKDGPDTQSWATVETYDISSKLQAGSNLLSLRALNYFNYGPYDSNPAGLIYKASITYGIDVNCLVMKACDPNASWKNHGDYVSCVAHECEKLVKAGLITGAQMGNIVSDAAKSSVGKK